MILIRADGNARIGMGHLMRCMTVAEELAMLQGSREGICFVCADEASGEFVRENGFRSYVLGTDYRDMESELPQWKEVWALSPHKRAKVLVDSYYVTDLYLEALGRTGYTVLMDDYGTHCYPVDCVINYNAPADLEAYRKLYGKTGSRLLIGSSYTPLRRQFRMAAEGNREEGPESMGHNSGAGATPSVQPSGMEGNKPERAVQPSMEPSWTKGSQPEGAGQESVREVLITTGGGDSGNIAGKILDRIYNDNFLLHVVTGRFHPNFRELQETEKKHGNIQLHHDVKDMAGLMARCQIALTAGGTTIYELAALGVPFICFSYAENQEALVAYIGEKEIADSAGNWHKEPEPTLDRIGILFEKLAEDPGRRAYYRRREKGMVDGEGAVRLARELLKPDA